MTLAELRALKPSTIQERWQVEVAAQTAELNENMQKFFDKIDRFMALIQRFVDTQHVPGLNATSEQKKATRTPIAEK